MAKILVVDDEFEVRRLFAKWLEGAGYTVVEAATGGEAVNAASAVRPDLILMDVKLPDITGFVATEHIRALPGYRALPVICITGLDMRVDVAHEGGCTDLLLKPVEREALLAAVGRHLKHT